MILDKNEVGTLVERFFFSNFRLWFLSTLKFSREESEFVKIFLSRYIYLSNLRLLFYYSVTVG